ncbi:MAG: hypothetical protein U0531_08205 [Dehalococcoidia bacterium]
MLAGDDGIERGHGREEANILECTANTERRNAVRRQPVRPFTGQVDAPAGQGGQAGG